MKVYFSGSFCVGKTTLTRYVAEKYKLPIINEAARTILSENEWQVDNLRHDIQQVNNYQSQVFYRQIKEEQNKEEFVSDRSALDALAFSAQHSTILSDLYNDPQFDQYLEKLYDDDTYIFFVRPAKSILKADGVREQISWDGIIAIDAMIKFMLQLFKLRHYTISMDSMQERLQFIDNILG